LWAFIDRRNKAWVKSVENVKNLAFF